eukprot:TRINITY_DN55199_c0_g1_i1.p2 TRINITY_DN55199_c0_g1~~TRINITY_DN55199_c0_g1_i1.p2  ORF type:complete len:118 (-),score=18.66 TRINITY_DN55199_c0_g1_i1:136-453(-)
MEKKVTPPYSPNFKKENYNSRNINQAWKDDQEILRQNALLLSQPSVQALFNGYYYDYTVQNSNSPQKDHRATYSQTTADTHNKNCLLYTSPSPRDLSTSRMPSSA